MTVARRPPTGGQPSHIARNQTTKRGNFLTNFKYLKESHTRQALRGLTEKHNATPSGRKRAKLRRLERGFSLVIGSC
jgi:hypothetical protein